MDTGSTQREISLPDDANPLRALIRERTPILNALAEGVVIADLDGKIAFVNDAAAAIHGVSVLGIGPEQYSAAYGLHTMDGRPIPESDLPLARALFNDESVIGAKWRIRRKDGDEIYATGNARPLVFKGRKIGAIITILDETDRLRADRALRDEEERFRQVFENAGIGMLEIDADWNILGANQAYREIAGYEDRELQAQSCLAFTHPDDVARSQDALNEAATSKSGRVSFEKRYVRKNGSIVWIRSNLARISSAGSSVRFLKVVEDITERKRIELLRDTENRILELAMREAEIEESLSSIIRVVEETSNSNVLASILLLDSEGTHLHHGAAPSLPAGYCAAIDGVAIGPDVGSCGTAAYRGETVEVSDIANDPLWTNFKDLAQAHGLRACWSTPIIGSSGAVLGTFAMYYAEPRNPSAGDLDLVAMASRSAALVIERAAARQALQEQSAQFQTLADNIPTLAWMAYADGHIFWYNKRWYEYTGTDPETQKGWGWELVHDPDELPRVVEGWKRSLATGDPFEMTFPLRGADGLFRPFLTRVVPIRDESGSIIRWFGTNTDVSSQVEIERALQEETRTLETINRTGAAIVSELELEKVVQLVTDAAVELTGAEFGAFFYNVHDDNGDRYTLFTLSGAERSQFERFGMPRATKVFAPTFDGEGVVRSNNILKDPRYGQNDPHFGMPKGHLPVVSYLAVPVVGRSGEVIGGLFFGHPDEGRFTERHERLVIGIAGQAAVAIDNARLFRDAQLEIANRLKAEQAVRMLNETLETRVEEEVERRTRSEEALWQLQKMETVGQLSGGIAHDFNNLLQVIHGNLSLLQHSLKPSESKPGRWIANALLAADRAAALTQRLLAFSRRQPLDPRSIDANRMIEDMRELLERTLGETVELRFGPQDGLWAIEVDVNQLENAILNLAVNARDAMPNGGRLTITTQNAAVDEEAGGTANIPPGDYVRISVSDEGVGMSAETLQRAVEPFFTTKEVGKGTGLGLSMVYGFIQQSGGQFLLESEPQAGTTASIFLPRHDRPVETQGASPVPVALDPGHGETILVCEDDEAVRQFTAETLRDLGYSVLEASDAAEAMAVMQQAGRAGDPVMLLCTDIVLPGGKTGADLAAEARALQPGLLVLYTSGYTSTALDPQGRIEPGVNLLQKPFGIEDLASRVRQLLNHH